MQNFFFNITSTYIYNGFWVLELKHALNYLTGADFTLDDVIDNVNFHFQGLRSFCDKEQVHRCKSQSVGYVDTNRKSITKEKPKQDL